MYSIVNIIIILIFFKQFHNIYTTHVNTTYRSLPPLYEFDDYDQCLSQPFSAYCIVFAEVEPNSNNDVWLEIENKSRDLKHNYRHENLFFGVCMKKCNNLLHHLTPLEIERASRNNSLYNEVTDYYRKVHKRAGDYNDRLIYQNVAELCLNQNFFLKYNLSLRTSIEYCENSQRTKKLDLLDIIFCIILCSIVTLNIASSLYDYRIKLQHTTHLQTKEFYKKQLKDSAAVLLTSFSICRNYYRLTDAPTKSQDPYESDLKFTYTFRVFTMFLVILAHCIMVLMVIQIQNPEYVEKQYLSAHMIIFQNGSALLQIFFVLSGFLMKLKFDQSKLITTETRYFKGVLVYIYCFINRYLRLLPSLLMVIFFNATLLIHSQNGPFWRHLTEAEYTFCREYWWKNIFMINNFMIKESCAHHTWFLAADMQLFELFLLTVILTAKFKILKRSLYVLHAIFAFVVPGLITYIYELDAVHFHKPETYRYLYFKDVDTFYLTYPQFYCNMGGYMVGLICAEVYMKFIKSSTNSKVEKITKYRGIMKFEFSLLVVILLIGFGLLFSGVLVINTNIEKPSLWLSLYAGLYRNLWSIFGGFILLCMLLKMGGFAYEIACMPIFRILGKISFQTYLWHATVLRILEGYYRQPVYLNNLFVTCQALLTFIITSFVAFFMVIFVEYPIAEVVRHILKPKISQNAENDQSHEMKPHLQQIHI